MYVQSWNIEKPNNLSNFGSNKTKDHKTGQPKSAKVMKSKVLLPQTYVTLADFGDPVLDPLVYVLPKLFKLFGFPTFRL